MAYNLCLAAMYYPSSWRKNRTTLIPKTGKDTAQAANWRPITIGPIIGRIFSGIIDASLRQNIKFNYRQKGFTSESGTYNNVALLQQILANMKRDSGGICSILDISKAFDTVPHGAITPALQRLGVPGSIAGYICEMYRDCTTSIRCGDGEATIGLARGVKQGDPLSPFLFNAIVDPLLSSLDGRDQGIMLNGRKVSVLAFADDVTLVSETSEEARADLKATNAYFRSLGMTLSVSKCSAFRVKAMRKTWAIEDPNLVLGDETVKFMGPDETFKYLGVNFTPWNGINGHLALEEFVSSCVRNQHLALKPQQKLTLYFTYLYPKYRYAIAMDMPSVQALKAADGRIRSIVKQILHLPESTTDYVLYTRTRDGGLGAPRMETDIQFATLRSVAKMVTSEDPVLRRLAEDSIKAKQAAIASRNLGIRFPCSVRTLDLAKQSRRTLEHTRWAGLQCQGQGVKSIKGPV